MDRLRLHRTDCKNGHFPHRPDAKYRQFPIRTEGSQILLLRKTPPNEKRRKLWPRSPDYDSSGSVIARNREKSGATEKSGCSESPCGSRAAGATRKNEKVGGETENEANKKMENKESDCQRGRKRKKNGKTDETTKQEKNGKGRGNTNIIAFLCFPNSGDGAHKRSRQGCFRLSDLQRTCQYSETKMRGEARITYTQKREESP